MSLLIFLRNILQLILAPGKGWEDVSGDMADPSSLSRRYLYPLMGLAAVSVFFRLIYDSDTRFAVLLVTAFVVFVSLFVTFFFAVAIFKSYFYKFCEGEPNERKYTTVITYCVCMQSIFTIIYNVMPHISLLNFLLPLVVTLIFWKSDIYLRVRPDRNLAFLLLGICTIILPPSILQWAFA